MRTKLNRLVTKAWSVVTSQDSVVIFKMMGLTLQMFHEIEAYRKGTKKVGFRMGNDER